MFEFIDHVVRQLVAEGVADVADFRGLTSFEVDALSANLGMVFPQAFREYLLRMGRSDGQLFRGAEISPANLTHQTARAAELLDKNGTSLPDDACVFYTRAGSVFGFFLTTEGDDPPVYEISEREPEPTMVYERFSGFLQAAAETAIQRHRQRLRHPLLWSLGLIVSWELFYIGPPLALLGLKSFSTEVKGLGFGPAPSSLAARLCFTIGTALAGFIGTALLLWVYKFQYSMQTMFVIVTVCAVCMVLDGYSIGFLLLLAPFVAIYGMIRSIGQGRAEQASRQR